MSLGGIQTQVGGKEHNILYTIQLNVHRLSSLLQNGRNSISPFFKIPSFPEVVSVTLGSHLVPSYYGDPSVVIMVYPEHFLQDTHPSPSTV